MKLDLTPLQHVGIALVIQGLVWLVFKNWYVGALVGSVVFIVRELTQAEYRWIEKFGSGLRKNLPWYGAVDPKVWTLASLLDWICPTITCFIVAYFL